MQVMTKVHDDKYEAFGGSHAAFDPVTNLRVGVQVLKECIRRAGSLEAGLRSYVGSANSGEDGGYAAKVLAQQSILRWSPAAARCARRPRRAARRRRAPGHRSYRPGTCGRPACGRPVGSGAVARQDRFPELTSRPASPGSRSAPDAGWRARTRRTVTRGCSSRAKRALAATRSATLAAPCDWRCGSRGSPRWITTGKHGRHLRRLVSVEPFAWAAPRAVALDSRGLP